MKRIFTFLVSVLAVSFAIGQNKTAVFAKASMAPVIDGVVDAVWTEAAVNNIDRVVGTDTPTLGTLGQTTWQALWTDEGVYVLLKVTDDVFFPSYMDTPPGANNWEYDKPEVYFDVNYKLDDAKGPGTAGSGHYQFAPGFTKDKNDGTPFPGTDGVNYAFMVTGSNYVAEYFIPFSKLLDATGARFDRTGKIGFDVIIIDRDGVTPIRQQAVWSGGSYGNLDAAGYVTFDGAVMDTYIDDIKLTTGGTITTDKGTLQIVATLTPANATYKDLNWSVTNGTGKALIDATGLLKGLTNGTVTVNAKSTDTQGAQASVEVTISGQAISRNDIYNSFNLIKNWNLDTNITSWSGWQDGATQIAPIVTDGVVALTSAVAADGNSWHYQFNQSPLAGEANVPYVFAFKSWSDVERLNAVDFEDIAGNGNKRYGATTDTQSGDGRSEWHYTTTTTPTWFTFHVNFDQMVANTVQKVQWMESQAAGTAYLDSVLLVTQAEYDKLATLPKTAVKSLASSISRVYPSPVGDGNTLFVELSSTKTNVAIYNAVGQKMMEKVSTGTITRFDVSSLLKGLYFVKLGDGSTQKFIR